MNFWNYVNNDGSASGIPRQIEYFSVVLGSSFDLNFQVLLQGVAQNQLAHVDD